MLSYLAGQSDLYSFEPLMLKGAQSDILNSRVAWHRNDGLSIAVQGSCSAFASDPRFHLLGAVICIQQNVPVERPVAMALQVAHHLHSDKDI